MLIHSQGYILLLGTGNKHSIAGLDAGYKDMKKWLTLEEANLLLTQTGLTLRRAFAYVCLHG